MNNKTVVVLGMHRSGTSMIAGILSTLGIDMGKELLGKHWSNPRGHFEDLDFVRLNNRIMESAGGYWDSPPCPEEFMNKVLTQEYEQEIKRLIDRKNSSAFWGMKDPRLCFTLGMFLPFLRDPHLLVVHRQTNGVVKSLSRRNGMEEAHASQLNELYIESLNKLIEANGHLPRFHVEYETLLNAPGNWIEKIAGFLEMKVTAGDLEAAQQCILSSRKKRMVSIKQRVLMYPSEILRRIAKRI